MPYWKGRKIKEGIIRLDIGGKVLTNYLKETISYRQLNLMDEFRVVDKIKEQSCYCSIDYKNDMSNFEKQAKVSLLKLTLGDERHIATKSLLYRQT